MSDPVTNLAIEDVLSSIRRLVSEGDKSGRPDLFVQATLAPEPATEQAGPRAGQQAFENVGKFVLTPALRIAEVLPQPPRQSAAPDEAATEVNPTISFLRPVSQSAESRSALELRIAELEAAVTDQAGDWEPDGSENVPVVDWSSPEVGESLIFASRAMPQPDRRGVLNLGQIGTRIHPVILEDEFAAEPVSVPAAPYDPGEDLDLSAGEVQARDGQLDPDEPEDIADYLDDSGALDEVALRKLVVEIVRQELQGPMGERITRNVRKMVRREIYRILASQEFES